MQNETQNKPQNRRAKVGKYDASFPRVNTTTGFKTEIDEMLAEKSINYADLVRRLLKEELDNYRLLTTKHANHEAGETLAVRH